MALLHPVLGRTIPEEAPVSSLSAPRAASGPAALPISRGMLWLVGTALVALTVYYFIGVDEGAMSVFGKSTVIHEFVHDSRHFLGFACH